MDFGQATLLALLIFVLVAAIDHAVTLPSAVKIPLAFALGILIAFLVANSDFGSEQIVGGHHLDKLNGEALVIVGILLGAFATGIDVAQKAVRNIGQNQG